jgi:hypothetical protein
MSSTIEFVNINEFNDFLSNNLTKYDINTYFTKIHELFNNNVDISFMGYFLSLIEKKDEFCVEHQKLIEYGIIKEGISSTKIKDCIANEIDAAKARDKEAILHFGEFANLNLN